MEVHIHLDGVNHGDVIYDYLRYNKLWKFRRNGYRDNILYSGLCCNRRRAHHTLLRGKYQRCVVRNGSQYLYLCEWGSHRCELQVVFRGEKYHPFYPRVVLFSTFFLFYDLLSVLCWDNLPTSGQPFYVSVLDAVVFGDPEIEIVYFWVAINSGVLRYVGQLCYYGSYVCRGFRVFEAIRTAQSDC